MKRAYIIISAIVIAMVFTMGCRDKQGSDERMYRLIANENRDLKERLQAETKKRDDEIRNIQKKMQAEIKKRDDEIQNLKTQCQNEKRKLNDDIENLADQLEDCVKTTDEKIKEQMKKYCEDTVSQLMDWNTELTAENEQLKTELTKIKGKPAGPQTDANN